MAKTRSTYLKVAATAKKKADKLWAQAKAAEEKGDGGSAGNLFRAAEKSYETATRAEDSAQDAPD